ncbi:MAG: NADH-quinone oxidoreductase subunit A [Planctomycetota bacterium]
MPTQDASTSLDLLDRWAPFLVLLALVIAFAAFAIAASTLLGGRRRAIGKGGAYECGMTVEGTSRIRLSIHFYLVAVLFILFDVESLLLIPWAVAANDFAAGGVGGIVLAEVAGFVAVLAVGLAYVWRKGGLTWDR